MKGPPLCPFENSRELKGFDPDDIFTDSKKCTNHSLTRMSMPKSVFLSHLDCSDNPENPFFRPASFDPVLDPAMKG